MTEHFIRAQPYTQSLIRGPATGTLAAGMEAAAAIADKGGLDAKNIAHARLCRPAGGLPHGASARGEAQRAGCGRIASGSPCAAAAARCSDAGPASIGAVVPAASAAGAMSACGGPMSGCCRAALASSGSHTAWLSHNSPRGEVGAHRAPGGGLRCRHPTRLTPDLVRGSPPSPSGGGMIFRKGRGMAPIPRRASCPSAPPLFRRAARPRPSARRRGRSRASRTARRVLR